MPTDDKLADERHSQVMAAVIAIHHRLDQLNGRTRETEQQVAVLADRSSRSNALSWSSMGAVLAGGAYWLLR
jgi:hypothetical protein|tara:strand:- start:449 stop:664 length:216 start_codon:yes stop_codon:yes gene_type:complete